MPDKKDYIMPKPDLGEVVMYRVGPEEKTKYPAIVVRVNHGTLDLFVLIPDAYPDPKAAVRWEKDPNISGADENGVWAWGPGRLRISELESKIEALESRQTELEASMTTPALV